MHEEEEEEKVEEPEGMEQEEEAVSSTVSDEEEVEEDGIIAWLRGRTGSANTAVSPSSHSILHPPHRRHSLTCPPSPSVSIPRQLELAQASPLQRVSEATVPC